MSAGLVLETILVVNLALGREKEWKMLEDDCLWIKKKKSLILREFKIVFFLFFF